jgi:hypothetical protein
VNQVPLFGQIPLIGGVEPAAIFDGPYRYFLTWPTLRNNDRILLGIGANPSKAGRVETYRIAKPARRARK